MPAPDGRSSPPRTDAAVAAGPGDGARHSVEFYRGTLGDHTTRAGELVLIRCLDGPRRAMFETFPPRLEIPHHGGVYVLEDDGPVDRWTYRFVTAP